MKNNPSFYSILTAQVRYDKRLKPIEKLLYSEISALLNMRGECYASNKYFAELYDVSERAVTRYIQHLEELGYIRIEIVSEGLKKKRYLQLLDSSEVKLSEPIAEPEETEEQRREREDLELWEEIGKEEERKAEEKQNKGEELKQVEEEYLENYQELYEKGKVQYEKPVINWGQTRKLERACIDKYGIDIIIRAVRESKNNKFVVEKGYVLSTILSSGVLAGLINHRSYGVGQGEDEYIE